MVEVVVKDEVVKDKEEETLKGEILQILEMETVKIVEIMTKDQTQETNQKVMFQEEMLQEIVGKVERVIDKRFILLSHQLVG